MQSSFNFSKSLVNVRLICSGDFFFFNNECLPRLIHWNKQQQMNTKHMIIYRFFRIVWGIMMIFFKTESKIFCKYIPCTLQGHQPLLPHTKSVAIAKDYPVLVQYRGESTFFCIPKDTNSNKGHSTLKSKYMLIIWNRRLQTPMILYTT